MIILGIETSGSVCGAGILENNTVLADFRVNRKMAHAEILAELTDNAFKLAGIRPDQISGIAISIGPGSFTGLRIGLSYAKGLALGLDKPLLPVSSLEACLPHIPESFNRACVLIPARKNEYYSGFFVRFNDDWQKEKSVEIVSRTEAEAYIEHQDTAFAGEGTSDFSAFLSGKRKKLNLPELLILPSGWGAAVQGMKMLSKGIIPDLAHISPEYIKTFQGVS